MTVWTYIIYLGISVAMTVWVAQTLFKHGRIFLVETFSGKEDLADSVNHLLVVGFYLINIGYVTLALKYGAKPADMVGAIEVLSTKVGLVLLVLGFMHFFNLAVFSKMRRRTLNGPARHTRVSSLPEQEPVTGAELRELTPPAGAISAQGDRI
ncbi:MAG: hypothetical protein IIA33_01710 [Planctomycetes bacterium]|nr:hypothetical protein [Planctomycetota bacterium]